MLLIVLYFTVKVQDKMDNIINILAVTFLPLVILLVAHFLNRSSRPVSSKRIAQYKIEIPGVGYEFTI